MLKYTACKQLAINTFEIKVGYNLFRVSVRQFIHVYIYVITICVLCSKAHM